MYIILCDFCGNLFSADVVQNSCLCGRTKAHIEDFRKINSPVIVDGPGKVLTLDSSLVTRACSNSEIYESKWELIPLKPTSRKVKRT